MKLKQREQAPLPMQSNKREQPQQSIPKTARIAIAIRIWKVAAKTKMRKTQRESPRVLKPKIMRRIQQTLESREQASAASPKLPGQEG